MTNVNSWCYWNCCCTSVSTAAAPTATAATGATGQTVATATPATASQFKLLLLKQHLQ